MLPDYLIDGPQSTPLTFAFTHGAGAPMDSDWMNTVTAQIVEGGYRVVRFEFPYMAERRETGKKRPPNTQKVLLETWRTVIEDLGAGTLVIGGKSMGGRMASMVADETKVRGLICLGYPFHPPGRPDKLRTEHLSDLKTSTLICQGERDTFGTKEEVPAYPLSKKIKFHWLSDGDHGFKPRKKSGHTDEENIRSASDAMVAYMRKLHA